jgi:hypothetical protein
VGTDDRALQELYAASYARLVGIVGAVGGDRQEAEEAVQDAFVRLLGRGCWRPCRRRGCSWGGGRGDPVYGYPRSIDADMIIGAPSTTRCRTG